MKKLFSPFMIVLGIFAMLTATSCKDDDEPIIPGDGGTTGINVADGLYLALGDNDPSSTAQLKTEVVEAEDFKSMERDGFNAGYMWLEAGSYSVVQIADKAITATIGGTQETVTDEGSGCALNDYSLVKTAVDGAAFNVATSGLYKVTHDAMTNELTTYKITEANIIGAAAPNGWGEDTKLTGSVNADGGKWEATGIVMRNGAWKVRMNCRWSINRRTDPNALLSNDNGYQYFTNFGGEVADLKPGASNFELAEDGEYTVTIEWDPRDGWSLIQTRTGDAPVLSFDPNDFNFGIIGDATAGGWDADRNMLHSFENDIHTWYGVVTLAETGAFKFRTNDSWDFALGGTLVADGISSTLNMENDNNIASPGAGQYYVTVSTADEGETWIATMIDSGWSVIGAGSPSMNWDDDTAFNSDGFDAGVATYSLTGEFSTGEWKIRAGNDWKLNLGGGIGTLTSGGDNITLSEAGTYKITFTFDGAIYAVNAEQQ